MSKSIDWIFLSKDGTDPYINSFAHACGIKPISTEDFDYDSSDKPIVLRGILKHKIMKRCWEDGRPFYYMDTGYFGNEPSPSNPNGWKYWHRIVKNNLQHTNLIDRPDDRWTVFKKQFKPWKKTGRKILIAKPDEKPCKFYGIDLEQWTIDTINEIKKYTDRPIEVRERASNREERIKVDTLEQALNNDVFALVTYNSVAATEAIMNGIPAFTLAPANAAMPVSSQDLSKIENPFYADEELKYKWGCHLSYGQFHTQEMKNGRALEILQK
jgi:hypothetical protein